MIGESGPTSTVRAGISAEVAAAPIEVLGIRHHGPGSARSVRRALDQLRPSHVVIEGPPELDEIARYAASEEMVPPVAALVYAVEQPRRAVFYPLAEFSPEWIALRWAHRNGARVSFADLPATNHLAHEREQDDDPAPSRDDPIARLAQLAGYDDPERWWEDAIEHRGIAADALARFRRGDRRDGVDARGRRRVRLALRERGVDAARASRARE